MIKIVKKVLIKKTKKFIFWIMKKWIISSFFLKKDKKIKKISKKKIESKLDRNIKLNSLISLSMVNFLSISLLKKIPKKREIDNMM